MRRKQRKGARKAVCCLDLGERVRCLSPRKTGLGRFFLFLSGFGHVARSFRVSKLVPRIAYERPPAPVPTSGPPLQVAIIKNMWGARNHHDHGDGRYGGLRA